MKNNELTEVKPVNPSLEGLPQEVIEYVHGLVAENEKLKSTITEINNELYGQGFEVLGWHLNGDTEPLDNWFTDNGWVTPETPATDASIAEIKAHDINLLIDKLTGLPFSIGVSCGYVKEFAANLRAGRKG